MTPDETARAIADLTKRVQQLENADQMRRKTAHYPPPRGLRVEKERPGAALGLSVPELTAELDKELKATGVDFKVTTVRYTAGTDTSLGHYAEFNEDDCA